GCGTPSSTDSAPASPSPAVLDQLISQARAHGQATAAAAQEQQRAQQRPLPVQIASTASHQYGQITGQQNSQLIQQHHQPRRTQFGSHQAQRVSSSSPHQAQPSYESGRVLTSTDNDESSRVFNAPHVVESGPILLPPKD
ncbi:hypothetical protein OSTOST_16238, partial [Ostertagia ostertagi]